MGKKIRKNKASLTNDSGNIDKKNMSKKANNVGKQNLGIAKDNNLKFKSNKKKNMNKLSKTLKQVQKTEGNFVNSKLVKVANIKKKFDTEKLDHSVQKKQQKAKVTKEERKKLEYTLNTKKKQEKHDFAKLNSKHKGQIKDSDFSVKTKKQRKGTKHAGDLITNQFNKNNNTTNKLKKKNNVQMPEANDMHVSELTKHKKKKNQNSNNATAKMNSMLQKQKKPMKQIQSSMTSPKKNNTTTAKKRHNLDVKKLEEILNVKQKQTKKEKETVNPVTLRDRMLQKLRTSRFRFLNESIYKNHSQESKKYFKDDPDAFKAYHDGYKQQVQQWPLNPLDVIISSIKTMPREYIIADFGCGEGRLATSVAHKVHSFDFVSLNDHVTACDMAHTPLLTNGVHVVVFCLSLMGTNLKDYIIEANRVLKKDGILKIAEVESRFEQIEDFIKVLSEYGFKNTWKDLSNNLFYFLDFKKVKDIGNKKAKLSPITLKPCLYKKR
ncbi:uncharacterized protein LOC143188752 isoform X2 [Calliopsis andreniformis]|uniref:uncharacterized protein LOC143188752 isoform X2 n=1 Tax=Calliopsis andreniformis TaxID=337506 RepID=UPI003FCD92BF